MAVAERPKGHTPKEIRSGLNVSREKMGHIMAVSSKTIERWEEREALPPDPSKRSLLARIGQILDLGATVYTREGFATFLRTPLPEFGNRTALQEMEAGRFDLVLSALASDYEGQGF
jgi:transcriptional regulator with XRE-family HTH domain